MLICSSDKSRRAWPLLALAPVMDPERDGYISLEEESTTSPQPCADSPKDEVPHRPRLQMTMQHYLMVVLQNWWKPGYLRSPAFMDMGLPGITDTGVARNLVTRRECPLKAGYQLSSSSRTARHPLPKCLANHNLLYEVLIMKSFAKTLTECHFRVMTKKG